MVNTKCILYKQFLIYPHINILRYVLLPPLSKLEKQNKTLTSEILNTLSKVTKLVNAAARVRVRDSSWAK